MSAGCAICNSKREPTDCDSRNPDGAGSTAAIRADHSPRRRHGRVRVHEAGASATSAAPLAAAADEDGDLRPESPSHQGIDCGNRSGRLAGAADRCNPRACSTRAHRELAQVCCDIVSEWCVAGSPECLMWAGSARLYAPYTWRTTPLRNRIGMSQPAPVIGSRSPSVPRVPLCSCRLRKMSRGRRKKELIFA